MIKLEEAYQKWQEEVDYFAEANDVPRSRAFFETTREILIENGDVVDLSHSFYKSGSEPTFDNIDGNEVTQANIQIDGFQFDNQAGKLIEYTLCTTDFNADETYENINTSRLEFLFKRAERFVSECIEKNLVDKLDSSRPQRSWMLEFQENFTKIDKINIVLLTNNKFSGRKKEFPTKEILSKRVSFRLFDLTRYAEIANSKTGLEPIVIVMDDYEEFELPCLKTSASSDLYESYLVSVPGGWLSKVYEDFSTKLLEQNVRTYLQARGDVNKGILKTIDEEPHMFFAYNNGLTTTAESVEVTPNEVGIPTIKKLSNFQIVNGGQTTASMYYASNREKSDLSEVSVQMKLSVVKAEVLQEVVADISRYANTQNKVSNADFFANHPFHRQFEKLCFEQATPRKEGSTVSKYWFYERATGVYKNKTLYASASTRKAFEEKYPKEQLIKKTELAKYIVSFMGRPDRVSAGADAAFNYSSIEFGDRVSFNEKKSKYGVDWFKEAIAKAIIFKSLDKIIQKSDWDEGGGTKAINVTYTIAWLHRKIKSLKREFDYGQVWKDQDISIDMAFVLEQSAKQMLDALKVSAETKGTMTSPTQWAKRQNCWEDIKQKDFNINENLIKKFTISTEESREKKRINIQIQREYDELSDYIQMVKITPSAWTEIHEYGQQNNVPKTPDEHTILTRLENLKAGKFLNEVEAKKIFLYLKKVNNQTDFDFSEVAPSLFL